MSAGAMVSEPVQVIRNALSLRGGRIEACCCVLITVCMKVLYAGSDLVNML